MADAPRPLHNRDPAGPLLTGAGEAPRRHREVAIPSWFDVGTSTALGSLPLRDQDVLLCSCPKVRCLGCWLTLPLWQYNRIVPKLNNCVFPTPPCTVLGARKCPVMPGGAAAAPASYASVSGVTIPSLPPKSKGRSGG